MGASNFSYPQCPSSLLYFAVPLDSGPLYIGFSALHQRTSTFLLWPPSVSTPILSKITCNKWLVLLICGALCHRQHSPCPAEPHSCFISVLHGHSSHSWKGDSSGTTNVGPSWDTSTLIQKHTSTSLLLTPTDAASSFWALLTAAASCWLLH